jgi:hypothetical protein
VGRAHPGVRGESEAEHLVNSAFGDQRPNVRRNGLEIVFDSNRSDTLGGQDLYSATHESINDPWSTPVNLGPVVNTSNNETRGSFWRSKTPVLRPHTRLDRHLSDHSPEAGRTLIEIHKAPAGLRVRRRAATSRQHVADFYGSDGTRTRDLRRDRPAFTLERGLDARLADLTAAPKCRLRSPRRDSRLQAFCKHRVSAAMSPRSALMQTPCAYLVRRLHFGGIRQHALARSRRLITRRSQVKSCPRYCGRRSKGRLSLAGQGPPHQVATRY